MYADSTSTKDSKEKLCSSNKHSYKEGCKSTKRKKKSPVLICAFALSAIVLLSASLVAPCLVTLYQKVDALEKEVMLLKSKGHTSDVQLLRNATEIEDNVDIVSRMKRKTMKESKKKRNKNKKSKNDRRKDKGNGRKHHEVTALHMVIDENHHTAQKDGSDLKTGERGSVMSFWKYADRGFNYKQVFSEFNKNDGTFTIKERGLYIIYSQMTYFDRTGRWSHMIAINQKPFIKCLASEWGIETDPDTGLHYNTIHQCYTSAITYMQKNDIVSINSMYPERVVHTDQDLTFWGIIKLT